MSRSLDEWDSYNFAFALSDYDVVRHRPHPPGYPLYVFFGRLALYFTKDPLTALTVVSAFSGAFTVVPIYWITRKMYDRATAVLVSAAIATTPTLWISSECALSDTLFTFLLSLSVFLLYSGKKGSEKSFQLSFLVYGLAIGARPTPAALAFLVLWIPATKSVLSRMSSVRTVVRGFIGFLMGCVIWFLPMIALVGWNNYWLAMMKMFVESGTTESAWSRTMGLDPIGRLAHIIVQIMTFSLGGAFVGTDPLFAATNPYFFLHGALLVTAIMMFFLSIRKIVDRMFLFLWIVPYFTFTYFFGTLNYPRYYLPIIPGFMIPIVASTLLVMKDVIGRLASWRPSRHTKAMLQFGFPALLIGSFFINTLGFAIIIHSELAPTRQVFNYVTVNYSPHTTIIEFHEHRVFEYYHNNMQYLHVLEDENKVFAVLSRFSPNGTVLLTTSAYNYLISHPVIAQLHVTTINEFFRDPHVVVEDHRIRLYRVTSVKLR